MNRQGQQPPPPRGRTMLWRREAPAEKEAYFAGFNANVFLSFPRVRRERQEVSANIHVRPGIMT